VHKLLLDVPTHLETDRLHLRETKKQADGTLSGTLLFGLLCSEFEARGSAAA
jgi:hypothetical protein